MEKTHNFKLTIQDAYMISQALETSMLNIGTAEKAARFGYAPLSMEERDETRKPWQDLIDRVNAQRERHQRPKMKYDPVKEAKKYEKYANA